MIMKGLRFCCFLILLFSSGRIAYTMPPVSDKVDTLQPLVPKGVFLTHAGFKLVLDERLKLLQCQEVGILKDSAINNLINTVTGVQYENNLLRANDQIHRDNVKTLKKNLFWTNLANGVGWGTAFVLAIKLLF